MTSKDCPKTVAEMLRAAAWFLDAGDKALTILGEQKGIPYPAGDEVQNDLRLLADFFEDCPELDKQIRESI